MQRSGSQKALLVISIISIVFAVLGILAALLAMVGGSLFGAVPADEAAEALAAEKAAVSEKNRRYRQNLKEQAKTDPAARKKIEDRRIRKNELARLSYAESKGQEAGKELVNASA